MRSEPQTHRRLLWQLGLAQLLVLGSTAWVLSLAGSPRLMVLAALPGLAGLLWGVGAVQALVRQARAPTPAPAPSAQALNALHERMALLEAELEHAPVALWRAAEGRALPLNAAARRLMAPGVTEDLDALIQMLAPVSASPQMQLQTQRSTLVQLQTSRGVERWLLARRSIVLAGQELGLVALLPLETQLEAEHLRAQRQLVHVLTHEIMNSLTPIVALSRCALEMQADPAQAQDMVLALEAVSQRAESLSRFVSDYRQVSAWPEPQLAPVDVAALFDRLRLMVEADWQSAGGQVHFELDGRPQLMADAGQLEQALLNLIRNARQATQGVMQPQLWVSARLHHAARLRLMVRDNGPGVPPGLESDIFTPFFSTRSKQGGEAGSGIGLAVVRQLVHGMGGSVRYARHVSGGACFVLSF